MKVFLYSIDVLSFSLLFVIGLISFFSLTINDGEYLIPKGVVAIAIFPLIWIPIRACIKNGDFNQ